MSSSYAKWKISLFSGLLFMIVINPISFDILNNTIKNSFNNNKLTFKGLIILTCLFILIVRYSMDLDIV